MKTNKRLLRQLKNISKICTVDAEKKTVTVPLHYQNCEELLDPHLSCPEVPVISDEAVDYLLSVIADIPEDYSVEYVLTVDDCGEYTNAQLLEAFQNMIENTYYYHDERKRHDNVLGAFFIIIGFLALTVEILGGLAGWFGPKGSVEKTVIEILIDVVVWVFLWEGAAIILLTYENESTIFSHQMERLNRMSIQKAGGNGHISMNEQQFTKGWIMVGNKEAFARGFILLSNIIFVASFIWQTFSIIIAMRTGTGVEIILSVIECILTIFLVISNISFYLDKGSMKKYAVVLSFIVLLFNIAMLICYQNSLVSGVSKWFFSGIDIIGLFLNILCLNYIKKQSIEIEVGSEK